MAIILVQGYNYHYLETSGEPKVNNIERLVLLQDKIEELFETIQTSNKELYELKRTVSLLESNNNYLNTLTHSAVGLLWRDTALTRLDIIHTKNREIEKLSKQVDELQRRNNEIY